MNRATLFFLVTLVGASPGNAQDDSTQRSPGLDAFADICLSNAADFSKAAEKAASYGMELMEVGSMKIGETPDQSVMVQIKANSCTITTPSQRNKKLGEEFRKLVAELTGTTVAKSVPFTIRIDGKDFAVMHDRKGGESFVLLRT